LAKPLTAAGVSLETGGHAFGELRAANEMLDSPAALRGRMLEDGYLWLRGLVSTDDILDARRHITDRLGADGMLDPGYPGIDAVARPAYRMSFRPDLAQANPALHKVLYTGAIMQFFGAFLGETVLHYDFTWLRAVAPGMNSQPHCDIVYMGRGTFDVYTAWTPLGDVSIGDGPLMILEDSHRKAAELADYLHQDVDSYCLNGPNRERIESGALQWEFDGVLQHDAAALRRRLGGRWLTADFRAGDVLVFTMGTVHASIDNQSKRIRLSSDSRYQRASEPADHRWIGPDPVGHGTAGKRGRIC
jgi:hypothetical protein